MSRVSRLFLGIDYHERFCSICAMDAKGQVLLEVNTPSEADGLVRHLEGWLKKKFRVRAALEACGGAAHLADQLRQKGWEVDLAHPGYVSHLKRNQDKTDKQDAYVLADLARVDYLPKVWLAPEYLRQLRSLVRHRQRLAAERRATKLQIRALMRESGMKIVGRAWTVGWQAELRERRQELGEARSWILEEQLLKRLEEVDKNLKLTEAKLVDYVREDQVVKKLLEQTGVGLITAVTLRAEIGNFGRFNNGKQLARFCGTAPVNHSTGGKTRELGLGRQCNRELRRTIVETAHRLTRLDPRWKQMKANLRGRGKSGAEAAAAVANRWIRWLHHQMVRDDAVRLSEEAGCER